ncbi:LysR family transcriptional regulator [Methylopila sp. M107]|uniref:LysR family transcriptional regulator n=1 Tax=Methylopila sp. M107 TaxID=1101190 RepID=UPI0003604342|nr:LysR family transcriptional regulator [Methylopila sp. M107]
MAGPKDEFPFSFAELNTFLATCDEGSMSAAARRLGVSQPAVSIALNELEGRLGTKLVDRSVRPLALTPAGSLLRQRASALLSEARLIAPEMREVDRGRLPLLRIGVIDSLARSLSGALARVASEMADEVAVQAGLTAGHASNLLTRKLDVMIGLDDLADVADLERWPILSEPYVLALSPGLDAPETLDDLRALAESAVFVRYSARSSTGVDIDRHLRRLGLNFVRKLEFDTPYGVLTPLSERPSFAITTPICLIESGAKAEDIVAAPLPGPKFSRSVTLVAHPDRRRRAPKLLADAARAALRETVPGRLEKIAPGLKDAVAIAGE